MFVIIGEVYKKFNKDARKYIREVAKNIVSDKVDLKPKLKNIDDYAYKLDLSEEGEEIIIICLDVSYLLTMSQWIQTS